MTRGGLFFYSCFIDEIHLLDNRQNDKQSVQFKGIEFKGIQFTYNGDDID